MPKTPANPFASMMAVNPFFVFWSIPWLIMEASMQSCLTATVRPDARRRNREPGQIPVPPVLQDSKDKDLFA